MTIALGQTVRDSISGFEGIVTGRVEYITGCNQVLVGPKTKDGALIRSEWFDEDRVEVILGVPTFKLPRATAPGSDRKAPVR